MIYYFQFPRHPESFLWFYVYLIGVVFVKKSIQIKLTLYLSNYVLKCVYLMLKNKHTFKIQSTNTLSIGWILNSNKLNWTGKWYSTHVYYLTRMANVTVLYHVHSSLCLLFEVFEQCSTLVFFFFFFFFNS